MVLEIRFYGKNSSLKDNEYSKEEEIALYDYQLQDIVLNTRWYLDALDYLVEYRVSWKNYRSSVPTKPYKYTKYANSTKPL